MRVRAWLRNLRDDAVLRRARQLVGAARRCGSGHRIACGPLCCVTTTQVTALDRAATLFIGCCPLPSGPVRSGWLWRWRAQWAWRGCCAGASGRAAACCGELLYGTGSQGCAQAPAVDRSHQQPRNNRTRNQASRYANSAGQRVTLALHVLTPQDVRLLCGSPLPCQRGHRRRCAAQPAGRTGAGAGPLRRPVAPQAQDHVGEWQPGARRATYRGQHPAGRASVWRGEPDIVSVKRNERV